MTNVQVFGSVARREAGATNDVDLLVDLEPGRTLVDLAAFRDAAAAILETPVDVATLDVLKPSVREEALREAVPLWGREERERLHDMLEAIGAIRSHAAVVDKASPELVRDAILYRLVVIGEAIKALPREWLARQPNVN